jgi:hypothetical protein
LKSEVEKKLSDDEQRGHDGVFHYEDGVPVFDTNARLHQVENEQAAAKKRDEKYKDEQLKIDRRMMWFTGILVLCTAATGVINIWQGTIAKKSAEAASENAIAAKSQAEAAKEQVAEIKSGSTDTHTLAQAARDQAIASKQQSFSTGILASNAEANLAQSSASFQDDQRAWVGIGDAMVTEFEVGKPIKVEIQISNSGKTPALFVERATVRQLSNAPMLTVNTPRDVNATKFEPATSIPPQGHYMIRVQFPDSVGMIKSKIQMFYIFGEVRYQDVFKRSHSTQFCVYIADPDNPRQMSYCPMHNGMN